GLTLVVPEMRRELVADAVADAVKVLGRAQTVVDRKEVATVVADAGVLEPERRQRRRRTAPDVELDHLGLDRGAVGELDDVRATLARARADTLGTRVLAHVDAVATQDLREQRGALRMVGRVDLARAHEDRADVETRVDLRELGPRRTGAEDRDALRKRTEARALAVRPETGCRKALELRHLRDRADRDDDVFGLELARALLRLDKDVTRCGDARRPAHRDDSDRFVAFDVPGVVGVVAALADDHVIAARRSLLPRIVAAARAHRGGVEQGLRRHAAPERARAAEEIALHERHARAARAGVIRGRLTGGARADNDEIEALAHERSAYCTAPSAPHTNTSRRSPLQAHETPRPPRGASSTTRQSTQLVPSHQRWRRRPSLPIASTSIRSA